MALVLPGIIDRKLKTGWRGDVVEIGPSRIYRVAFVYGKTLEDMRRRKRVVVAALRLGPMLAETTDTPENEG